MHIAFTDSTVSISTPGYIKKMLKRFRPNYHSPAHRPATTPGKYTILIYRRIQLAKVNKSPPLSSTKTTELQAIVVTLLYYARAVGSTLLPISNEIASQQASPTANVMAAGNRALSYAAGQSTNAIIYHASVLSLSLSCSLCRWCLLFPRQS
jgi:hypothetical protein